MFTVTFLFYSAAPSRIDVSKDCSAVTVDLQNKMTGAEVLMSTTSTVLGVYLGLFVTGWRAVGMLLGWTLPFSFSTQSVSLKAVFEMQTKAW